MKHPLTMLRAAIPAVRGIARHIEEHDDTAKTVFNVATHQVEQINTPQCALRRAHEVLHARHSNCDDYAGIEPRIAQYVEDCRIHLRYWPWPIYCTPKEIVQAADALMISSMPKQPRDGSIGDFLTRLRAISIYATIEPGRIVRDENGDGVIGRFYSRAQDCLASSATQLIRAGLHNEAALMIESVFYPTKEPERPETGRKRKGKGKRPCKLTLGVLRKARAGLGRTMPKMDIIELPRTMPTSYETDGLRLATSGTRIHRPALRRPVLPQRLFWRRSPVSPAGVVLFDASNSMKVDRELLLDCCRRAPTATIAYYSGSDGTGVGSLWIFAKGGWRADYVGYFSGGNAVDGPAMDWLMQQDGPRMFVTDSEFCGAADSYLQVVRLEQFELQGEITVYPSYQAFQTAHPQPA